MKALILYVILLQVLSCAVSFVSRRNVGDEDIFILLNHEYPRICNGVRFNIESQNTTTNVHLNYDSCGGCSDCECYVEVRVDCGEVQKLEVDPMSTSLDFEFNTVVGQTYELEFRKRTVSTRPTPSPTFQPYRRPGPPPQFGVKLSGDISLEGAEFLSQRKALRNPHPDCLHRHKLLVIADSISVTSSSTCAFREDTESEEHGFAALVAASVQAELHVVRSQQMFSEPLLTDPIPKDLNYWPPAQFAPDIVLVLVMLGTLNHTNPEPYLEPHPAKGLVDRLSRLRIDYPQAKRTTVLCVPMEPDAQCGDVVYTSILHADVSAGYEVMDPSKLNGAYGCDAHPNVAATQQFMADFATPIVKKMLDE